MTRRLLHVDVNVFDHENSGLREFQSHDIDLDASEATKVTIAWAIDARHSPEMQP